MQPSKQDLRSRRRLASVLAAAPPALRAQATAAPPTEEAATAPEDCDEAIRRDPED